MASHRLKDRLKRVRQKPVEFTESQAIVQKDAFRVLLCVHKPKFRARVERAVQGVDWNIRSLKVKEDPIGLINQKRPDIFIISIDSSKNVNIGFLNACQRWRPQGMKVIVVSEGDDDTTAAEGKSDIYLSQRWKSIDMRKLVSEIFRGKRHSEPNYVSTIQETAEELLDD